MITIDLAISFSIGGIIGFILKEIIGHHLARARALEAIHISEFNKIALKLREGFLPVLLALNPAQFVIKEELPVFLDRSFHDLKGIVTEFANYLKGEAQTRFLQAWYEYHCHPDQRNENCIPFFEQYSCRGLTTKQEHEMKKLIRDRIDKVLEFAKPK
jgi:hypothetical protein